jgi:hypothetical protein
LLSYGTLSIVDKWPMSVFLWYTTYIYICMVNLYSIIIIGWIFFKIRYAKSQLDSLRWKPQQREFWSVQNTCRIHVLCHFPIFAQLHRFFYACLPLWYPPFQNLFDTIILFYFTQLSSISNPFNFSVWNFLCPQLRETINPKISTLNDP